MAWLIPAVVSTLLGSLILTVVYGFLYFEDRQTSIGVWALAWAVYTVRFLFRLLLLQSPAPSPWLETAVQLTAVINAFLLLCGTYHFINQRVPRFWSVGAIVLMLWTIAGTRFTFSFGLLSAPVFVWASGVYAFTGIRFLLSRKIPGAGRWAVGIVFILWGIHKLSFPLLGQVEGVASWGYLLGAAFELLAAFGILLVYFQRARSDLITSEYRLRQILQHMPVMLVAFDEDLRLVEWNRECEKVTGYRQEELAGNPNASAMLYGSIESDAELRKRSTATSPVSLEWPIYSKDGSQHTIAWNSMSQQVSVPGWKHWVIGVDITHLKATEQALRESETNYATLIERSPNAVMVVQDGRYVFSNPVGAQMLGYADPAEVVGTLALDSIAPEYRDLVHQRLNNVDKGTINSMVEMAVVHPNGTILPIESRSVPIIYRGEPAALVISQDITERKRVDAELTQYRHNLEALVAERTERLRLANEELVALSRVKDEFVSNVSHELRTPIANLKVYHHLLMRKPDALPKYMNTIRRETDRLENMIESLLQLSRLDQARVSFEFRQMNLNALADEFASDRHILAAENTLQLSLTKAAELPLVSADPRLLEQALSVLLTNAIAYTPAGGKIKIFTTTREQDSMQWAGLGVSDTGPGIDPDEASQLFERFFRGNAARESTHAGTGLGLAIASEIVARHAGEIDVASSGTPGEGATFTIWLPAAGSAEPLTESHAG